MHVIATAGHVDHGKSTLVRALTGMEPDRWAEERRRGLTIDLGFAWTEWDGRTLAFVDVPGHERFVPNMLAGVGPAPAVLFVVAADEGWMPQSAEHLAALHAYGVRHGLLVVTKSDRADPERALDQARAEFETTTLAGARSVAVSANTGLGLDRLRTELLALSGDLPEPDRDSDVRLWVDRVFTVRGAGTVATGTLAGGTVRVGEELAASHTGRRMRIRGLHALGQQADEASATARVGVNLRGVDPADVGRGQALLTPGRWRCTSEIDVVLRSCDPERLHRDLVLHVGTAEVPVHVRPLGTEVARVRLGTALPLRVRDTGLLRDPGEHRIAAGLTVLDVAPPSITGRGLARRRGERLVELASAPDVATAFAQDRLSREGYARSEEFPLMGLPAPGPEVGGWFVHPDTWARARDRAERAVHTWKRRNALAAGMPVEELRQELGVPSRELTSLLARDASLAVADGIVRANEDEALPTKVENALRAVERQFASAPFHAPESDELQRLGLGARELAAAVRLGRLSRIADGVLLGPGALARAETALSTLDGPFTVSDARRCLDTTRRVAVPLLEALDEQGVTERVTATQRLLRRSTGARQEDSR